MSKETGILFKPSMVEAILAGNKTMTRRLIKPQPIVDKESGYVFTGDRKQLYRVDTNWKQRFTDEYCKFIPEDILYVRETHFQYGRWIKDGFSDKGVQKYKFKALSDDVKYTDNPPVKFWKSRNKKYPDAPSWYKRNSLFMPKSAARLKLQVTNVHMESLQDISEADAINEGIERYEFKKKGWTDIICYKDYLDECNAYEDPRKSFKSLWVSINGEQSWNDNPYIWCYKFNKLK